MTRHCDQYKGLPGGTCVHCGLIAYEHPRFPLTTHRVTERYEGARMSLEGALIDAEQYRPEAHPHNRLLESIVERLTSMAEYAEHSLSPNQDLWKRMDALRQMLRGEIARLNQYDHTRIQSRMVKENKMTTIWALGAPENQRCTSFDCDFDIQQVDRPFAAHTRIRDGQPDEHYCPDCFRRESGNRY